MTWDEAVRRLESARLNYVAAVWRGSGFDPEIADELDQTAEALRLLLSHAIPREDRERALEWMGEAVMEGQSLASDIETNKLEPWRWQYERYVSSSYAYACARVAARSAIRALRLLKLEVEP